LDELLRSTEGAHNALLDIEELTEEELDEIKRCYSSLARRAVDDLRKGKSDLGSPEVKPKVGSKNWAFRPEIWPNQTKETKTVGLSVAELLLIREPERRFYRECRLAGLDVTVYDESSGDEQVYDISQLRLRFAVTKHGRTTVKVRFDPLLARFSGSGFEFTWSELMFKPDHCLDKVFCSLVRTKSSDRGKAERQRQI
jgi:hypothetical protein